MHPLARPEPLPAIQVRGIHTLYANFCRVLDAGDELILDFGLHSELGNANSLVAPQRIALSPYTAKRLLDVLTATLETYERNFGPVETQTELRLLSRPA
jgi:hypothetical protein